MIRRELDSRFLNSAGSVGLGPILPPPHGLGKLPGDSGLYRPLLPPPSMPPPHFPPLGMAAPPTSMASSLQPPGPGSQAPGLLNNLGLAPGSTNAHSVKSVSSISGHLRGDRQLNGAIRQQKPGKWNAMHVRIAWEVYHTQQRLAKETGEQRKTPKLNLNLNLAPKLNLGIGSAPSGSGATQPPPSASVAPPSSTASAPAVSSAPKIGFDTLPGSANPHNPTAPFGFSHQATGFLPRLPSVPTPPPGLSLQPPGSGRHSAVPDQWNRYLFIRIHFLISQFDSRRFSFKTGCRIHRLP